MRISDWSSDVCSSDLPLRHRIHAPGAEAARIAALFADAAHLRIGQVRRAVYRVDRAAALLADVVQPVARLAAAGAGRVVQRRLVAVDVQFRSEEHTSELQSLMRISYAVFCLKNNIYHPFLFLILLSFLFFFLFFFFFL